MKNIILDKRVVIGILIFFVVIIFILLFDKYNSKVVIDEEKLLGVSNNNYIEDSRTRNLYNKYNGEDELKFHIIGNNSSDEYALYYRKDKVTFDDFSNILKNYILLDTFTYYESGYDNENDCFLYPLETYKDIYRKNYGSLKGFSFEGVKTIKVLEDNLCISDMSDKSDNSNYDVFYDTFVVNTIKDNDIITIYERVIFIEKKGNSYYFYKDYEMKDLVYKLKNGDKLDTSFINNSKIVSNVLLEYQDKLDIYEYTYVKGVDTFYLESVNK